MRFILENNLTHKKYEFDNIPVYKANTIGYEIGISLPEDIVDGEYNYTLTDGGNVLGSGLLQIGEYTAPKTEYNKKETIKVYNG